MATIAGTHEIPAEASGAPGDQRGDAGTARAAVAIAENMREKMMAR